MLMAKPSTNLIENCKLNENSEHKLLQSNLKASIN